jgi:hypothetical protein
MTTTEDEEEEEEGIPPMLPVLASVHATGVVRFRSSDAVISRRLLSFPVAVDDSAMSPGLLRFQCRSHSSLRRSIDIDKTRLASTTSLD